jgi:hypothetical protein
VSQMPKDGCTTRLRTYQAPHLPELRVVNVDISHHLSGTRY